MPKTIISEGKTTNEAIEKGLKELKISKEDAEIKVLEDENKRSFFSILTPRIVKVQITIKEKEEKVKREYEHDMSNIEEAESRVKAFLEEWLNKVDNSLKYEIKIEDYTILVNVKGEKAGMLIGYRGETLNSMQVVLSSIANRNFNNKIKLVLDIENYREKREKTLEELAQKISKTVLKTGKSITLEPMSAYERKIIHSKLQQNSKVETYSIGEGDNRRVVISKVKNKNK